MIGKSSDAANMAKFVAIPEGPEGKNFLPIDADTSNIILGLLSPRDLKTVAGVSRYAYFLSADIRIRRFKASRSESPWWRCLRALAEDIPGEGERSFAQAVCSAYGPNMPSPLAKLLQDYNCLSRFTNQTRPKMLGTVELMEAHFILVRGGAGNLLSLIDANNSMTYDGCTCLSDCIDSINTQRRIAFCHSYDTLDYYMSAFLLYLAIQVTPEEGRLDMLLQSPLSCALWAASIKELESAFSIFSSLLESAIRLCALHDRSEKDNVTLRKIELLLDSITEDKLSEFIDSLGPVVGWVKRNNASIIRLMLQNVQVIKKLKKPHIMQLLMKISDNEQGNVINNYPLLHHVLTLDILEEWLKNDPCSSVATKTVFTHPALLAKLSHANIVHFSFYLMPECFAAVLESPAFKALLESDQNCQELLMNLCAVKGQCDMARWIAKNDVTSLRFTADQVMQLIRSIGRTRQPFSTNIAVCQKLSNEQLLEAACLDPNSFFLRGLDRLENYTAVELIQFSEIYLRPKNLSFSEDITRSLLERLPAVLNRCAEDEGKSLSSSQWLIMMSLHLNLGLFIAKHHLPCLSNDDLSKAKEIFGDCLDFVDAVSDALMMRDGTYICK